MKSTISNNAVLALVGYWVIYLSTQNLRDSAILLAWFPNPRYDWVYCKPLVKYNTHNCGTGLCTLDTECYVWLLHNMLHIRYPATVLVFSFLLINSCYLNLPMPCVYHHVRKAKHFLSLSTVFPPFSCS